MNHPTTISITIESTMEDVLGTKSYEVMNLKIAEPLSLSNECVLDMMIAALRGTGADLSINLYSVCRQISYKASHASLVRGVIYGLNRFGELQAAA